MRVDAQLVDTARGQVLWSGRFDDALADVFALQDEITTQLVRALAIRVSQIEQRRVFAKPTGNLEAYDYVLRARPALQRPTRASNVEARTLLKHAIALDPNYAAAYAALAETYYTDTSMGWTESPSDSLGRAEELALDALSLDASEVPAHVLLARIDILHQNYQQAEQETELAIAINPNDAESLAGRGNVLMWLGQTDAAIDELEQAQRIDPDLGPIDRFALSLAYYLKGRYDDAIEQAELNLRDTSERELQPCRPRGCVRQAESSGRRRARRGPDTPLGPDLRRERVRDEVSKPGRSRPSARRTQRRRPLPRRDRPADARANDPYCGMRERFWFALLMFPARSCRKRSGPTGFSNM